MFRPADILKKLEPIVRPDGLDRRRREGATPTESLSFDALIENARRSPIESGEPVETPADLDLTDEQHRRLEAAADQARWGGSRRSLVVIDGRALVLDVRGRRVEGERSSGARDASLVADIDAAVLTRPTRDDGIIPPARLIRRLESGGWPVRPADPSIPVNRRPSEKPHHPDG